MAAAYLQAVRNVWSDEVQAIAEEGLVPWAEQAVPPDESPGEACATPPESSDDESGVETSPMQVASTTRSGGDKRW